MKHSLKKRAVAFPCLLCVLAACSRGATHADASGSATSPLASASGANGALWVANGATACDKYLTPDFVRQIFKNPAGHAKQLSPQACSFDTPDFASISITLIQGGPSVFDAHQKYLANPTPLSGVGDRAVNSATGVEAVKGSDRMCAIGVLPPFGNKLSGEPLAHKLGEICNKLFALP
ncbi:MAG: hypothetical protein ACREEB_10050 [Caulobacteraceae bacterium]